MSKSPGAPAGGTTHSPSPPVLRVVNIVSQSGRYGGPSDTALRQAEIAATAVPVTFAAGFFSGDQPEPSTAAQVEYATYQVRPLLPAQPFPTAFSFAGARSLWRSVGKSGVVHVSIARELMPILALLFGIIRRRGTIAQPHGMLTSRTGLAQSILDVIVRPLVARSSVVLALTGVEEAELRSWLRGRGRRFEHLHNPVVSILKSELNPPADPPEILFLGRLHPRKRLDVFLRAAELSKQQALSQSWVVVGPDEGELLKVKQAVAARILDRYEPPIPLSQVAARVSSCTVFVLPSEREAWGNVVVVALSLGRPVIVTESSAISAMVVRYGAGIVVPDGDPDAIAAAIHTALADRTVYDKLAQGARDLTADQLSDDSQRSRLLELYRSTAKQGHGYARVINTRQGISKRER